MEVGLRDLVSPDEGLRYSPATGETSWGNTRHIPTDPFYVWYGEMCSLSFSCIVFNRVLLLIVKF